MRPKPLLDLLESVRLQTVYPSEILIIDGSTNEDTQRMIEKSTFLNLSYFMVSDVDRGLTKQRNFGIQKVGPDIEIVCFLDDDTILDSHYFEKIMTTYETYSEALAVGGYIVNENNWEKTTDNYIPKIHEFYYDGWKKLDGSRFVLRKLLGLDSNVKPGFSPEFSHGRSIGFIPPSGKTYEVEQLMGGVSSFRKSVFKTFQFSTYFEGYGLYEDADFTLRLSKTGKLYINTCAQLSHYHNQSGRPNQYQYGKMVVRNGWYVWRIKNSKPRWSDKIKWHSITLLLTVIRFINIFGTNRRKEALTEALGRTVGWFSLFFDTPK
jgi:GT2 family glycosyltransferase